MEFKKILLLGGLIISSCTVSNEIVVLQESVALKAKELNMSSEIFPIKILKNNEKFIVVNSYAKENIFTVYDMNTMDSLYSFGNIGRSNTEFGNVYSIISDKYLEVMDVNKIKYIDIQDTCVNITSTKQLPLIALNTFGKINDSIYYTRDKKETNDEELMIFNIKDNSSKYIGEAPKWAEGTNFAGFDCCVNSKKDRIAFFYSSYPEFKIMNLGGKTIRKVNIKVDHAIDFTENLSTYFISSIASENFIYTTWIDKTYRDLDMHKGEKMNVNLLVIDWDGNIKANYTLEGMQRVFIVKDDAKLYSFSTDNRKIINEFNLPEIK